MDGISAKSGLRPLGNLGVHLAAVLQAHEAGKRLGERICGVSYNDGSSNGLGSN